MEMKNELMVFEQSGLGKLRITQINDDDVFNLFTVVILPYCLVYVNIFILIFY